MNDIPTSKKVFLQVPREEQIGTLFEWCQTTSSKLASDIKEHDIIKKDIKEISAELRGIGRRKTMTTSENIRNEISKQNAAWIWYRDHVLASTLAAVQTVVILAILYLAFGGKTP